MGKIVVSEFVSLDGVFENPGWTFAYESPERDAFKNAELVAADAMLLGRVTFEAFAEVWPTMIDEDGYADRFNAMPKHVVTSMTGDLPWNGTAIGGDLAGAVATLRETYAGDVLVFGSGRLVQALTMANLVDEFRLMTFPVVLGAGRRIFEDGTAAKLKLVDAAPYSSGVVVLTYAPA